MLSTEQQEDREILEAVLPESEHIGESELLSLLRDSESVLTPVPIQGGEDFAVKAVYELARSTLEAIRQLRRFLASDVTEFTVQMGESKLSLKTKDPKILREVHKLLPDIIASLKEHRKKDK
jgi:Sec-independent protein translocase protein TatA